jgi:hypothetical protein
VIAPTAETAATKKDTPMAAERMATATATARPRVKAKPKTETDIETKIGTGIGMETRARAIVMTQRRGRRTGATTATLVSMTTTKMAAILP